MTEILASIEGKELGISHKRELVSNKIVISPECADASITIGSENANVRAITIQLKRADGKDISSPAMVDLFVFADSGMAAFGTGGTTGIAIGTDGAALTIVAKKHFVLTSESDGDIDLTWTDTGTEAVYFGLRLPTGRIVMSAVCANT